MSILGDANKVWIGDKLIIDRTISKDQLRKTFEAHMPLPLGVKWDGDHYLGTKEVIGSFRNATSWDDMYRGYLIAVKEFGYAK